ncbi:T-cell surface glycoprotein CD3 delta chain [Cynoglossus semilaevis]|uniref:T-cell surface glycoprotein CD3 delta chain-like n=1 Tax=Cynoglossus semilaevis TaxID=244447 RepID=A0A3P8UPQ9_CYNSE|nr:T-cell surface glycoprotein CD3 delta chain-like [Cynoglossus semilaevis]XP_024911113.1 T-cell surface glycoprotein CD3 delta chain-like [Cynoglossus semilaevis]
MKHSSVWSLLLLWSLTVSKVSSEISVKTTQDGIKMTCKNNEHHFQGFDKNPLEVLYKDDQSGEYICEDADHSPHSKIFVKFRTCDNCIEFDVGSIAFMVAGEVIAMLAIGVGVHLVASHTGSAPAQTTSSERKRNVPNDRISGASNEPYQPLRFRKDAQKDEYDVINRR